jgi:hypothetical protein
MDKQNLNTDTPKSTEAVPNLPDECGDSLWDAVLAQPAPDLLQIKKADREKDAGISNKPAQESGS